MVAPTLQKMKVYDLAKELGQDGQHVLHVLQRMGITVKSVTSGLGIEEVKLVREHFRSAKGKPAEVAKVAGAAPSGGATTERRVGTTLIRRRSQPTEKTGEQKESPFNGQPAATASPFFEGEKQPLHGETPSPEPETEAASSAPAIVSPPEAPTPRTLSQETPGLKTVPASTGPRIKRFESPPPSTKVRRTIVKPPDQTSEAPAAPHHPPHSTLSATEGVAPTAHGKKEALSAATPPAPAEKPAPQVGSRRLMASVIKKVSTEEYLGKTIGPKPQKAEPSPSQVSAKPAPGGESTTADAQASKLGPTRIREVEVTKDARRDAGGRKVKERTDSTFRSTDFLKRELVHSTKKKTVLTRPLQKTQITKPAEHKRIVTMGKQISVDALARSLGVRAQAVLKELTQLGVTGTPETEIDFETAALCAHPFSFEVRQDLFKEETHFPAVDLAGPHVKRRPPVVTVMGHVDHGKTSLLDAIRKTKVAAGEAGGITQHIGAYTVTLPKGEITFIDTPGHEAFTSMRSRGAKVTDMVILVVSAVDGVMPQTLESVNHARAANVPILVAINKIDLPGAQMDRIQQTLAGHGLNPEEWGGDTLYVPVSAKTGKGIDKLLENILLQADLLEVRADYSLPARGTVIESSLDKTRGAVVTLLVQHGVLSTGDIVLCGNQYGKVRAMEGPELGRVKEVLPGHPVAITGLSASALAGDLFYVVPDEKTARAVVEGRKSLIAPVGTAIHRGSIEELLALAPIEKKTLTVVIKADTQGSVEAIRAALEGLPQEKVQLKVVHAAVGGITESDISLAAASQGVVFGFQVRPDSNTQKLAERLGVSIKLYRIIYEMLDQVREQLTGLVAKEVHEKVIGRAEVRGVFTIPKIGAIAGSYVLDGKIVRGCRLRLLRDSRVVYEGKISSLRRFKDDVREVASGFECGIGLENFNDLKMGDHFEAYLLEEQAGTL